MSRARAMVRVAALSLVIAAGARAQGLAEFGDRGRVLIAGALSLRNVSTSGAGSSSVTTLELSPSIDVFVAKNVALGLAVQLLVAGGDVGVTSATFLPSVGYNFDVAPGISWLPQLQLGLGVGSTTVQSVSTTTTHWALGAFAPLIVRPAGRLFVGFGPRVLVDVAATASRGEAARQTTLALQGQLGGWF